VAFILADLIVLPILDIYRRYYGIGMSFFILAKFYIAMAVAALIVEFVFSALAIIPAHRSARIVPASITFNYTTVLNIVFLALTAVFLWRFFTTGGPRMLRHMYSVQTEGD
jgi:hypothetical protein